MLMAYHRLYLLHLKNGRDVVAQGSTHLMVLTVFIFCVAVNVV
jgi:hypothetical protein